jgi:hypothetical protein
LQSLVSLNIYNQCQAINLASPVRFVHGGRWTVIPDPEIDVNTVMRNYIEFDSEQDILEGALMYRTQRQHAESDESARDESRRIQLLVAWHVEHTKELHIRALLVEHDRELDEDKLKKLHQKCWHLFNAWVDPIENEWLLDNAKKLKTKIKAMNGGYRWDIFIHETEGYYERRSFWIDTTR